MGNLENWSADADADGEICIGRIPRSESGACDACVWLEPKIDQKKLMLVISLGESETDVVLCHAHEIMLLQLLLNNYIRRRRRGKEDSPLEKEEGDAKT